MSTAVAARRVATHVFADVAIDHEQAGAGARRKLIPCSRFGQLDGVQSETGVNQVSVVDQPFSSLVALRVPLNRQ